MISDKKWTLNSRENEIVDSANRITKIIFVYCLLDKF